MWLSNFSIRFPETVIGLAVLVVACCAPGILQLRLRTDGHALVPPDSPELAVDRQIRKEFNHRDQIIVVIHTTHPNGIFNAETLKLIGELTGELKELDNIDASTLSSIATEHGHRVHTGTLNPRTFLDPFPDSEAALQTLRDDLRTIQLYHGTLIARDESAAAIFVPLISRENAADVLVAIQTLVATKHPAAYRIDIIGAPVAESQLGTHILADLGVPNKLLNNPFPARDQILKFGLIPPALGLMAIVFLVSFRSVKAAVLPLIEIGAALIFLFGLMGWLGVPIYLTTIVMPIVICTIGVADELHIFSHFFASLRHAPDRPVEALRITMCEMSGPVVKASITTAVGFLSFCLSPLVPLATFGAFTAIGVLFCMVWTLTVIPSMLVLFPPRVRLSKKKTAERAFQAPELAGDHWVWRYSSWVRRIRWVILAGVALLAVFCVQGARSIEIQDSWINAFSKDSAFSKAVREFNDKFMGTHVLVVVLDGQASDMDGEIGVGSVGDRTIRIPASVAADPESLVDRRIQLQMKKDLNPSSERPARAFDTWWITAVQREGDELVLTTNPAGGPPRAVVGAAPDSDIVQFRIFGSIMVSPRFLAQLERFEEFLENQTEYAVGGVLGPTRLLRTTNLLSQALKESERRIPDSPERVAWLWSQYHRIRGDQHRRQVLGDGANQCAIQVFLRDANFKDVAKLMAKVRDYEKNHLASWGMAVRFGGDIAVSQTLVGSIVTTQTRSLIGAIVGSFVMMVILGRSLFYGVLCILPCSVAVLFNLGYMGWTGMPLGVATSMFAAMTLGIADDFAIHFLERFRTSAKELPPGRAVANAIRVTGPAIVVDALAIILGFGVLLMSSVPANVRLGALLILSIAVSLLVTFTLLPAILEAFPGNSRRLLVGEKNTRPA